MTRCHEIPDDVERIDAPRGTDRHRVHLGPRSPRHFRRNDQKVAGGRCGRTRLRRKAGGSTRVAIVAALFLIAVLTFGPASEAATPPISLPVPKTGDITFYLSLPTATKALEHAAAQVATPTSSKYRHFIPLDDAARRFGATNAEINAIAKSIRSIGLWFAADPTRLFGRVTGSARQWRTALGKPLSKQAATTSNPFITYRLPARTPKALQPKGVAIVFPQAQVYDPPLDGHRPSSGARPNPSPTTRAAVAPTRVAQPWPLNTGTPVGVHCSSPLIQDGFVYTEQQIQTAYGIDRLRAHASGTPVITILDLGGGWRESDLELAGKCFGYHPPKVTQTQGDGVPTAIHNAEDETSLDLQTVASVAPRAELRLVQATTTGILDGFSRALDDPRGVPDVISLSYGGCAYADNRQLPKYTSVVDAVLAMAALTGVSSFVAAGDRGSTTCGSSVPGTSLSFPAVSPFVTAVGGTRLTLGPENTRVSEVVWNDSSYGANAAGGGAISRLESRPSYQDGFNPYSHRAVPDVSALADEVPGWPVVIDSTLQTVGGTSGSTPLEAAATALVDASQRHKGRPRIGLANGWFYWAASKEPAAFYDITQGNNDLAGVGCCQATVGYNPASGLGVPDWSILPATLPRSG
jgi:subtilase family serine protease